MSDEIIPEVTVEEIESAVETPAVEEAEVTEEA